MVDTFERLSRETAGNGAFADVEVVAQRATRRHGAWALTLVIDRPSGVDLALCEALAARINAGLDGETEPYTLEVESAGLDRALGSPAEYERFRDRDVRVVTTVAVAGRKTHRGRLLGTRGNALVLASADGELPIPYEMVKSANLDYDFRADLKREKQERRHADKVR